MARKETGPVTGARLEFDMQLSCKATRLLRLVILKALLEVHGREYI